jgi:hypothetical protein
MHLQEWNPKLSVHCSKVTKPVMARGRLDLRCFWLPNLCIYHLYHTNSPLSFKWQFGPTVIPFTVLLVTHHFCSCTPPRQENKACFIDVSEKIPLCDLAWPSLLLNFQVTWVWGGTESGHSTLRKGLGYWTERGGSQDYRKIGDWFCYVVVFLKYKCVTPEVFENNAAWKVLAYIICRWFI